jgi:hypothetical protein
LSVAASVTSAVSMTSTKAHVAQPGQLIGFGSLAIGLVLYQE